MPPRRRKPPAPTSTPTPKSISSITRTTNPSSTEAQSQSLPQHQLQPQPRNHHPARHLLSKAGHPPEAASTLFTTKIRQKPLLLRPTSPPPSSSSQSKLNNARERRRLSRIQKRSHFLAHQKPRPLSAKEKRVLGLYDLKREQGEWRYEVYEGLHGLWVGYMQEVLGLQRLVDDDDVGGGRETRSNVEAMGAMISSADLHGAKITVARAKDVDRVGCTGIVVRDTRFTFVVVTPGDEVRVVPKRDTVFGVEVPWPRVTVTATGGPEEGQGQGHGEDRDQDHQLKGREEGEGEGKGKEREPLRFEIHGSGFEMRPAERARRGFKWKVMPYL